MWRFPVTELPPDLFTSTWHSWQRWGTRFIISLWHLRWHNQRCEQWSSAERWGDSFSLCQMTSYGNGLKCRLFLEHESTLMVDVHGFSHVYVGILKGEHQRRCDFSRILWGSNHEKCNIIDTCWLVDNEFVVLTSLFTFRHDQECDYSLVVKHGNGTSTN